MAIESRHDPVEQLERLIEGAAGSARKTRLLAERILHELSHMARASGPCPSVAPASRQCSNEEGTEPDAESGWRLAA